MAKHGRGLICVPTTSERLQQLGIERMVRQNRETFKTDFQVSVDAARGITTGISAADRAETIRIMAEPTAVPEDLVQPGHVFPAAGAAGRRAAARRPHRGGGGPGAAGRLPAHRRDLRDHERRRHDGAAAGAAEVRQEAPAEDLHHRRPDPIPPHAREAGGARRGGEAADRLRRLRPVSLPVEAGRPASPGAGLRRRGRASRTCWCASTASA